MATSVMAAGVFGLVSLASTVTAPDPVPPASAAQCPLTPAGGTGTSPQITGSATPPSVLALRAPGKAFTTPDEVTTPATPVAPAAPVAAVSMPYDLPATRGTTGAEEAVDAQGRVPSTGGKVTWSQHAGLGAAYRDYYITMRWNYAAWNWDGTATGIDQAQYQWFADQPRLVLVTNPRTHKSIIAAAIEAGPGPWVGAVGSDLRGKEQGPSHGWPNPTRGTPAGYTGIVSGFPPVALAALDAKTGYLGQTGDELIYQWAPDQNAIPGPTGSTAVDGGASTRPGATCTETGPNPGPVIYQGVSVTIPANPKAVWRDTDYSKTVITAPSAALAKGIAAGLKYLGTPYVWGGGGPSGPDHGCGRADCLPDLGFDCSGLTSYVLANAGVNVPTYSGAQRDASKAVPWDQALPGDIIGYPGHVSIFLGVINGQRMQLEAPETGDFVKVSGVTRSDVDPVVYRWV
ncbi:hypothetical protein D1871_04575 [Nakamurella silvestris]|nr:hypothetical protein D1871_04575 [Nakamurella silvestris]